MLYNEEFFYQMGFKADDLIFSYTGVTDTELANIVINRDWLDKTQFVISNVEL